jgi:hypothetical protein
MTDGRADHSGRMGPDGPAIRDIDYNQCVLRRISATSVCSRALSLCAWVLSVLPALHTLAALAALAAHAAHAAPLTTWREHCTRVPSAFSRPGHTLKCPHRLCVADWTTRKSFFMVRSLLPCADGLLADPCISAVELQVVLRGSQLASAPPRTVFRYSLFNGTPTHTIVFALQALACSQASPWLCSRCQSSKHSRCRHQQHTRASQALYK